jgi:hypothetical protein
MKVGYVSYVTLIYEKNDKLLECDYCSKHVCIQCLDMTVKQNLNPYRNSEYWETFSSNPTSPGAILICLFTNFVWHEKPYFLSQPEPKQNVYR